MAQELGKELIDVQEVYAAGPHDLVVRLENNRGGFTAYALDTEACSLKMGEVFPTFYEMVPGILKPALDAFMFAIRHGILQKLCRERGIPIPDKHEKKYDAYGNEVKRDLNGEAAELLARVFYSDVLKKSYNEQGERIAVDVTTKELSGAYTGIFRRVPAYDAHTLAGTDTQPQAVASAGAESATAEASV